MSGAHRNANGTGTADVAHLNESIFHEVHKAWNSITATTKPWQIHGFNIANHFFPAGTDAIISNGDGTVSSEIITLDDSFDSNGFLTYAYNTLSPTDAVNVNV